MRTPPKRVPEEETTSSMAESVEELFGLTGKIAVVTGAAAGIGLGVARVLALAGATVVLADLDHAEARRQAAALTAAGHQAVAVAVDVGEETSIVEACRHIVETVGVPWLLVNNAALQDREYLLDATASEWDRIHNVNVRGAFLMTRETARAMVAAQQGGRIVNIASNALRGGLIKGLVSYTSSKGALAALSIASAFELAEHSITVNTILPGAVITPGAMNAKGPLSVGPATRQTPFGFQQPDEIGAAVLFFASTAARPITNQVLAVDGGFSIS
ncbi:SDR family NAD(P)-dependent oxidoreductase [Mycobacterium heckeshornense]|uniref:SDR family NAD(P)-dependent oxidoreductase n=1 Tax=Mycobacterium heckeshornense TaxID=110505 RepID=UPI001FCFD80F|nr:SDR family NAD(P)-dependent oxidoreductase [Mycobacterium heckeshornense]